MGYENVHIVRVGTVEIMKNLERVKGEIDVIYGINGIRVYMYVYNIDISIISTCMYRTSL